MIFTAFRYSPGSTSLVWGVASLPARQRYNWSTGLFDSSANVAGPGPFWSPAMASGTPGQIVEEPDPDGGLYWLELDTTPANVFGDGWYRLGVYDSSVVTGFPLVWYGVVEMRRGDMVGLNRVKGGPDCLNAVVIDGKALPVHVAHQSANRFGQVALDTNALPGFKAVDGSAVRIQQVAAASPVVRQVNLTDPALP